MGLKWDKSSDCIIFDFEDIKQNRKHLNKVITYTFTCFNLLSNPLVLIIPVIVSMKELYQDICRENFTWDEILLEKVQNHWQEILTLFGEIKKN